MSSSTMTPRGDKPESSKQETMRGEKEWTQAADKAREAASSVGAAASHAASAVGSAASNAACEVGHKADDLAASAGSGIREFGEKIGRTGPQSGMLGSASQAIARGVKDSGEYLESAKFSGMLEDLSTVVRRNPIPAILIALTVGCFLGRKLRS